MAAPAAPRAGQHPFLGTACPAWFPGPASSPILGTLPWLAPPSGSLPGLPEATHQPASDTPPYRPGTRGPYTGSPTPCPTLPPKPCFSFRSQPRCEPLQEHSLRPPLCAPTALRASVGRAAARSALPGSDGPTSQDWAPEGRAVLASSPRPETHELKDPPSPQPLHAWTPLPDLRTEGTPRHLPARLSAPAGWAPAPPACPAPAWPPATSQSRCPLETQQQSPTVHVHPGLDSPCPLPAGQPPRSSRGPEEAPLGLKGKGSACLDFTEQAPGCVATCHSALLTSSPEASPVPQVTRAGPEAGGSAHPLNTFGSPRPASQGHPEAKARGPSAFSGPSASLTSGLSTLAGRTGT